MTPAGGWCRSSRASTSKPFYQPGSAGVSGAPTISIKDKIKGGVDDPLPLFLSRSRRRSEIKRLFQLVHSLPKLRAYLGLDRSPGRIASRLWLSVMIENKRRSRQESLMKFLAAIIWRPGACIMMIILPNVHLSN
jgi:hypothetical protein